jgi:DNA repair exonuclease SbcCD ATPase subunit
MNLNEIHRRLEALKAKTAKVEAIKPDEDMDPILQGAYTGMKAAADKVTKDAEAIVKAAEQCTEESKAEVAATHQKMGEERTAMQKHVETLLSKSQQERQQMEQKHGAELADLRAQLADALAGKANAEGRADALQKANTALEKQLAAKPKAQPAIMPAAPAAPVVQFPDYIDATVLGRDLNGRIAGARFKLGKS